jgi:Uma2 family endonuclease
MNAPVKLPKPSATRPPPLEPGDRLTRSEFERRYAAMPPGQKAELIEGVVHMPAAVRLRHHADPHGRIIWWLFHYQGFTPGTGAGDNASVRLDLPNMPQPDGVLFIDPDNGGNVSISEDDYVEGSPELVAEVAASTVSIDLNEKLRVYQRNGVREYIVWRVDENVFDWFYLEEATYVSRPPDDKGVFKSAVFPGLWLDSAAMLRSDVPGVLVVLQQGLADAAHQQFVADLAASKS